MEELDKSIEQWTSDLIALQATGSTNTNGGGGGGGGTPAEDAIKAASKEMQRQAEMQKLQQIRIGTFDQGLLTLKKLKIDELKETTGNRDISTGGTTSGVTAASAIAAMQEAGSKLSRDNSKAAYRAYRKIINMVIERIRQFYDLPRCFRITMERIRNALDSFKCCLK